MKASLPFLALFCSILFMPFLAAAQCQFLNPTVELNSVTTNVDGNCVVNLNLGFEIDINNGNKIIFVHIWRTQDYTAHTYSTQNQPKENNILNDALATIIIDNDVVNNNPTAPANQVFMTTYGPDPGIDDATPPAINQVKDASDGLSYNRVVLNDAENIYRYTINNLTLIVPGACGNQINFTGDAWSSNANSTNPAVQCSMQGFSFLVNDPTISADFTCQPIGVSNSYAYTVSTTSIQQLSFQTDVYVDNGDNFFDASLDTKVLSDAGPYTITSGTPFYSGVLTYPAPYATNLPQKLNNLWIVAKNMTLTNTNNVVTTVSNALIEGVLNTCNATVLPVKLIDFTGARMGENVILKWRAVQTADITGYTVQRKSGNGDWEDVAYEKARQAANIELSYETSDKNVFTDISLYRLKMESADQQAEVSRNVLIPGITNSFSYTIAPNPSFDGTIKVNLALHQTGASVYLYDLQGRLVQSLTAAQSGSFTLANLKPGTYLVKIAGDNGSFAAWSKAIVLRR